MYLLPGGLEDVYDIVAGLSYFSMEDFCRTDLIVNLATS